MNCQPYVSLTTDNEVLYHQEKLPFTCSPTGAALSGTLSSISLLKNSTSGWKLIVKILLELENVTPVNKIKWDSTDIERRASVKNRKVFPSNESGLQIEISPIKVHCSDKGVYKCVISGNGNSASDSVNLDSESAPKTVGIKGKQKL